MWGFSFPFNLFQNSIYFRFYVVMILYIIVSISSQISLKISTFVVINFSFYQGFIFWTGRWNSVTFFFSFDLDYIPLCPLLFILSSLKSLPIIFSLSFLIGLVFSQEILTIVLTVWKSCWLVLIFSTKFNDLTVYFLTIMMVGMSLLYLTFSYICWHTTFFNVLNLFYLLKDPTVIDVLIVFDDEDKVLPPLLYLTGYCYFPYGIIIILWCLSFRVQVYQSLLTTIVDSLI